MEATQKSTKKSERKTEKITRLKDTGENGKNTRTCVQNMAWKEKKYEKIYTNGDLTKRK